MSEDINTYLSDVSAWVIEQARTGNETTGFGVWGPGASADGGAADADDAMPGTQNETALVLALALLRRAATRTTRTTRRGNGNGNGNGNENENENENAAGDEGCAYSGNAVRAAGRALFALEQRVGPKGRGRAAACAFPAGAADGAADHDHDDDDDDDDDADADATARRRRRRRPGLAPDLVLAASRIAYDKDVQAANVAKLHAAYSSPSSPSPSVYFLRSSHFVEALIKNLFAERDDAEDPAFIDQKIWLLAY
ncbi:hypothetical protein HK100_010287, partial [Physocladia obscura]